MFRHYFDLEFYRHGVHLVDILFEEIKMVFDRSKLGMFDHLSNYENVLLHKQWLAVFFPM
jgi:hypothetical protein